MSSRKRDTTPSLFDVDEADEELSDFEEVPAARFLSWSHAMQMRYCWLRDLDSAARAENETELAFFVERAKYYEEKIHESAENPV